MKTFLLLVTAVFCLSLLPSCSFVPDEGNDGGGHRPLVHFVDAPQIPYGQAARFGYGGPQQQQRQFMPSPYGGGGYNNGYNPMYGGRNQSVAVPVTPPGRNSIGYEEWRAQGNGSGYELR
jgi:hypothetical protein